MALSVRSFSRHKSASETCRICHLTTKESVFVESKNRKKTKDKPVITADLKIIYFFRI